MSSGDQGSRQFSVGGERADKDDETSEASNQNDEPGEQHEGRPTCFAPPSPPSLPSTRTMSSSVIDSTVAQFEAQCAVAKAVTPRMWTGASAVPPMPPLAGEPIGYAPETLRRTAQAWIEAVTDQPFTTHGTEDFARNLKTGERLCALVNVIRPGTIPHVYDSHLGYEQTENIENFIAACIKLGVPTHSLVRTVDIFEMKDTCSVASCVHALGSAVQVSCPGFKGPHLGKAADTAEVAVLPSIDDEGFFSSRGDKTFMHSFTSELREDNPPQLKLHDRILQQDEEGTPGESLVLNMLDVERPRTIRQGFNTTVGSVSDLRAPAPLSARARKMCPEELVNSPRALVYNEDPIGHPTRSPTSAPSNLSKSFAGDMFGSTLKRPPAERNHSQSHSEVLSTLFPDLPPEGLMLSPAGLWATVRESRPHPWALPVSPDTTNTKPVKTPLSPEARALWLKWANKGKREEEEEEKEGKEGEITVPSVRNEETDMEDATGRCEEETDSKKVKRGDPDLDEDGKGWNP